MGAKWANAPDLSRREERRGWLTSLPDPGLASFAYEPVRVLTVTCSGCGARRWDDAGPCPGCGTPRFGDTALTGYGVLVEGANVERTSADR